jgi:hypothetical protein
MEGMLRILKLSTTAFISFTQFSFPLHILRRMYRSIMRRKLGLLGKSAAAAAAAAANGAPGSSSAAAAAAAAGVPGSARPSWPLEGGVSAEVCAAAAAVAAAPLQPGSGQMDEVDDKLVADLLSLMEDTGMWQCVLVFFGGGEEVLCGGEMLHVDTFATHQWHCLPGWHRLKP